MSNFGRFNSPDPILISTTRLLNPQIWNLYSYVGNNPILFIDPTGEELVQLGAHTTEQINQRTAEINKLLKDKSLSTKEVECLKKERTTLGIEKKGNEVVGKMLKALEAKGELGGLQLSQITLTTDAKTDFAKCGPAALAKILKDHAFVIQGIKTMFIRTDTDAGFYAKSQNDSNWLYYGASALRHEKVHYDGQPLENPAYRVQYRVFQKFWSNFSDKGLYDRTLSFIQQSIEATQ